MATKLAGVPIHVATDAADIVQEVEFVGGEEAMKIERPVTVASVSRCDIHHESRAAAGGLYDLRVGAIRNLRDDRKALAELNVVHFRLPLRIGFASQFIEAPKTASGQLISEQVVAIFLILILLVIKFDIPHG